MHWSKIKYKMWIVNLDSISNPFLVTQFFLEKRKHKAFSNICLLVFFSLFLQVQTYPEIRLQFYFNLPVFYLAIIIIMSKFVSY